MHPVQHLAYKRQELQATLYRLARLDQFLSRVSTQGFQEAKELVDTVAWVHAFHEQVQGDLKALDAAAAHASAAQERALDDVPFPTDEDAPK